MRIVDPQLDTNFLIRLHKGEPEFIAYAQANRAAGLNYTQSAADEFLANPLGSATQLLSLEQQYGIIPSVAITATAIDNAATRLQNAFVGAARGRVLRRADAKVLAAAFLTGECLATGDERLFKRGKDLGLNVDFVGSGPAARRAAAYVPLPVVVPPP
jgi:predicted nucleic acid-binding protein